MECNLSMGISQKVLNRRDMEIGKQKENALIFDHILQLSVALIRCFLYFSLLSQKLKKMSSQQVQLNEVQQNFPFLVQPQQKQFNTKIKYSQANRRIEHKKFSPQYKSSFDIKKFEQNILKQLLVKNKSNLNERNMSNKKSGQKSLSQVNSFKKISNQRKISRSKSNSKKQLVFKKQIQQKQQKQILQKSHKKNTQILRQKLLSSLTQYDDYQMINIQTSIPVFNKAKILRLLTSLEQTKAKIQSKSLSQGRVKEQAKFIYFFWKMIGQEFITTRHLKQIILILHELNKTDLTDTLSDLYSRDSQIVKMLVECWMKLKMDHFFYQVYNSKQKKQKIKVNNLSEINLKYKYSSQIKNESTLHKLQRIKTQQNENKNAQWSNEQSFKNIKFLQPGQQKKLIERLYEERKDFINRRQRMKTLNDQQKQNVQLKKCTFKPLLTSSMLSRSSSRSSNIILKQKLKNQKAQNNLQQQKSRVRSQQRNSHVKGFQKAVKRMKVGQSQSKLKKQLQSYHSVGQNYQKIKQKPINPPKFLQRQKNKKQELILFVIQFEIGRHKIKVKIHPTDTQMSVSKKVAKIYGLKSEEQEQIREIVSMELNNYYKHIGEEVSEFIQN